MINAEKMTITLTRIDVCDLMLATTVIMLQEGMGNKWETLHDKLLEQLEQFDTEYFSTHK